MAKPEQLTIDGLLDVIGPTTKAGAATARVEHLLEEAAQALAAAGDSREKECRRVLELQRLVSFRLAGVLRSLQEGTP